MELRENSILDSLQPSKACWSSQHWDKRATLSRKRSGSLVTQPGRRDVIRSPVQHEREQCAREEVGVACQPASSRPTCIALATVMG